MSKDSNSPKKRENQFFKLFHFNETKAVLAVIALLFVLFAFLTSVLIIYQNPNANTLSQYDVRENIAQNEQAVRENQGLRIKSLPAEKETQQSIDRFQVGALPNEDEKKDIPKPPKKELVIIIDDVGNNLHQLEPFLKFPGNITFAVMPDCPFTRQTAEKIHESGKEVILHQPMEALYNSNAGPGAIYTAMTKTEIRSIIKRNIAQIPYMTGMNNHMGSLATRSETAMEAVLSVLKEEKMYFVDSLTIGDSAVHTAANNSGTHYWGRDVFLDNIQERENFLKSMDIGMRIAESRGRAILIGHVWSNDLAQTLIELYPHLVEQGFSLSTISQLMMEEANESSGN